MLSQKETQQQFSKNHGGLGRERFQRLISRQLEKGCDWNGAAALLGCFPLPCTSTHTHTQILGLGTSWDGGKTPLRGVTPAGSELSSVETGGSQVVSGLKSTFNFPSTSAVALEFGDGDSASAVWLLPVLCWQGGNQHLTLPLPSFTPKEICCSSLG